MGTDPSEVRSEELLAGADPQDGHNAPAAASFRMLDQLAGYAVPHLARLYPIVVVGVGVTMFTGSSTLFVFLLATMAQRGLVHVDLLPVLAVLAAINLAGIVLFILVIAHSPRTSAGGGP